MRVGGPRETEMDAFGKEIFLFLTGIEPLYLAACLVTVLAELPAVTEFRLGFDARQRHTLGSPSVLFIRCCAHCLKLKYTEREIDCSTPSSTEVKECVELCVLHLHGMVRVT